ncbi:MAG: hypothetical protein H7836_10325 [Magnetococcus sp. YQC-3]
MRAKGVVGWMVGGVLALLSGSAGADNAQLLQLLEILHKKGTLSTEEYQMLRGAADAPAPNNAAPPPTDRSRSPPSGQASGNRLPRGGDHQGGT